MVAPAMSSPAPIHALAVCLGRMQNWPTFPARGTEIPGKENRHAAAVYGSICAVVLACCMVPVVPGTLRSGVVPPLIKAL
jgi:hypothetical protein